nr:uncharacterized protein LOC119172775 [Rhipicephalus microplus]
MCRSDENLAFERNYEVKKDLFSTREVCGGTGNSTENQSSQFFGAASGLHGSSHSPLLSNQHSSPAPLGLVFPKGFVHHSRAELGTLCAGAPQNIALALVNPTGESRGYQIRQLRSSVDGRTPKNAEMVNVQFPGLHTLASGGFMEIEGSFLSMTPGLVEAVLGIFLGARGGHKALHSVTLAARVEEPCVTLEPSQDINFEGLHFDGEQSSVKSCGSYKVTIINKSCCAVPVVVCIRGGEGVFAVRSEEVEANKDQARFSVILPSKEERTATSFIVDCSTRSADRDLVVQAKLEVLLDGCLLSRRLLAGVGLRASIKPPSLTLEHVNACEGEGVFAVRSEEVEANKDQARFSVILPSKEERTATSFIVDCSTRSADRLVVQAKLEVLLDGCLLSRRLLAGVGLRASIKPPSLTLEHVNACEPLEVCCGRGQTKVWLKNDSPCPLDLELSAGVLFHVKPGRFRIHAADHMELHISATESAERIGACSSDNRCESVLEATVTPQGFKVALVNLVSSFKQHATSDATALASAFSKHGATGGCKKLKTLESNCRFLLWANLHNLASKVKSLKIRNPNAVSINMEVSVGKPYHELFQVEMRTENGKHASSTLHLDTNATVDIYVSNAKCSRLLAMGRSFIESRLVIKSYSGSHTDIKNVALYALEGELKVELRDTCCLEKTRHLVDMGVPQAPGTVATYSFTIVNSGDWDAFVYLATDGSPLLGSPKESPCKGGKGTISVTSSCFVLRRMKSKTVSLTYEFGAIDAQLCAGGQVGTLSVIRVLFGFEALRQAAKRAFSKPSGGKLQPSEMMLPFLGSFENEGEVEELTVSGSVVEQVFMKTVSQAVVAVIASSGAAEALIQSSTAASLAPLEDLTFLNRPSLSELAE